MTKAIFLDRDGVLINNSEHYYIWKSEQMSLVDGVPENLRYLQDKGFRLFVITNQGGISRGLYSKFDVEKLHDELKQLFKSQGIEITEMVYCPHHPDNEKCFCRKPEPGMIEKIVAKYRIEKKGSFLIGDHETDMEAAQRAGIEGILIPSNSNMFPRIFKIIQ